MSTSHTHTGPSPEHGAAAGRGTWHDHPDADDYPYTLRELRSHLERLGYRARQGQFRGEDVRDMQARVAEFRDSLERRARTPRHALHTDEDDENTHATRTHSYERRIQAALADMAAELRDDSWSSKGLTGLDVASRAWLDQRFAALRGRLEDALSHTPPPKAQGDIYAALEEARRRLNTMEHKLSESADRQDDANRKIINLIDTQARQTPSEPGPSLAALDQRLEALQQGFDRAMSELDSMKRGTQRLAVRASATVARQTARATALHVARAVREAAPEQRFSRLEESVTGCMTETRTLRQEAGVIQQTLEEGLEDLRGRINELTLISRKAAASAEEGSRAAPPQTQPMRNQPAQRPAAHSASTPRGDRQDAAPVASTVRRSSSLISRLGFAAVVVLLVVASFAMLYAQLSDDGWRIPAIGKSNPAPAATSKIDKPEPSPVRARPSEGRVILPGIILTDGAPDQDQV